MPFIQWEPAPRNMNLQVFAQLPAGFIEMGLLGFANVRMAKNDKHEVAYFCEWKPCNGWVLGRPYEHEENTMSPHHPLSGRQGTVYYCCRCGNEIAFTGMVS